MATGRALSDRVLKPLHARADRGGHLFTAHQLLDHLLADKTLLDGIKRAHEGTFIAAEISQSHWANLLNGSRNGGRMVTGASVRQIMDYDAEFRREEVTSAVGSSAKH